MNYTSAVAAVGGDNVTSHTGTMSANSTAAISLLITTITANVTNITSPSLPSLSTARDHEKLTSSPVVMTTTANSSLTSWVMSPPHDKINHIPVAPSPLGGNDLDLYHNMRHHPLPTGASGHHVVGVDGGGGAGVGGGSGEVQGCVLFNFVVHAVFVGVLCLLGFAADTLCFALLWREQCHTGLTFLLQASCLADLAVLWLLFLRDVIPSLGYVVTILHDCSALCGHLDSVTRPVMLLVTYCVAWFTVLAVANHYVTVKHSSTRTHLHPVSVDHSRKHVLLVMIFAVICTLPSAIEKFITVDGDDALSDNTLYRSIYTHGFIILTLFLLPLAAQLCLAVKQARLLKISRDPMKVETSIYKSVADAVMSQVLLCVSLTYMVCYTPETVYQVLQWVQGDFTTTCGHLQYYLSAFCSLFIALNSSVKLFVLCLFDAGFSTRLRALCCTKIKQAAGQTTIYSCADMSEMTLISNNENVLSNC